VIRLTGSLDYLLGLERALDGFDVAHVAELHNPYSLQAVRARARGRCRAVVASVWENIPLRRSDNQLVERRVRNVAEGADHFLAVSERARRHLELAGAPAERITVLPMGVDVQRFTPTEEPRADGPLRVLSVARLVWEKGVEDLVVSLQLLADRGIDAELTLAGGGPLRGRLEELAHRLGLDERVRLVGTVPYERLPALHREHDVFVLGSTATPMWREQFGFAVVEAMASGLPVLVGFSGSLDEVVGDADSLVPPQDAELLADRLAALWEDPELRRQLGERNRRRALERFDQREVRKGILELYQRVAP
jgi:glycosyltransferase involved in cell wall biosynthesis